MYQHLVSKTARIEWLQYLFLDFLSALLIHSWIFLSEYERSPYVLWESWSNSYLLEKVHSSLREFWGVCTLDRHLCAAEPWHNKQDCKWRVWYFMWGILWTKFLPKRYECIIIKSSLNFFLNVFPPEGRQLSWKNFVTISFKLGENACFGGARGCRCAPFRTRVKVSLENFHPHFQSCSRVAICATDAKSAFFSDCSLKEECNLPRDSRRGFEIELTWQDIVKNKKFSVVKKFFSFQFFFGLFSCFSENPTYYVRFWILPTL